MMTPSLNVVYKFSFVAPFNVYDGYYKVLRILTFDELLADNVSLLDLYTGAGLTQNELDAAASDFRSDRILKLVDITDESNVRHIPMSLGELEPDPNVKAYPRLVLAVDLGVFDNVDKVIATQDTISSIVAKGLGISEDVLVFSTEDTWMTLEEYNEYEAARVARKTGLVNLYSEVQRLRKELDAANVKIQYYEEKLIALGNSGLGVE